MDDFNIRQADDADRDQILRLVSKMWGEDVSARYEWMYEANPHGRALTWLACESATGEAVGCTSIFPRKVMVDGRLRTGSIGGDCYIEPRARRRGLATALHRVSFAAMREQGVEFMYGPPNPANLHALVKAGSRVVAGFQRWVRPLTGRAVYRAAFGNSPSKLQARLASLPVMVLDRLTRADRRGYALDPIERFGAEFDRFFAAAAQAAGAVVCARDSAYLEWRYFASPTRAQLPFALRRDGEIAGLVALEIDGENTNVVDLFTAADQKTIDAALQLIIDRTTEAGCASLEISCTPDATVTPRLRRLGFIWRSERDFQVAAAATDPQRETLLNGSAWRFLAADQDMDTFFSEPPE